MRPDLAALRVDIQGAQAEVRVAKSAERPQLVLGTNLGKTFSNVNNFVGLNYGITLGVQIPIFSVTRNYNVKTAEDRSMRRERTRRPAPPSGQRAGVFGVLRTADGNAAREDVRRAAGECDEQ